jgi:HEAT repeat protein
MTAGEQTSSARPTPRMLVGRLVSDVGTDAAVDLCVDLLAGGDPDRHEPAVRLLSGHDLGVPELRDRGWKDYWWRVWGARGLLYVWADRAGAPVVHGLDDGHWRPAEMCLRVASLRELAEGADAAVRLAGHDLSRVRATAVRMLGRTGETEHVAAVRSALDDTDEQVRRAAGLALDRMALRLDRPDLAVP